MIERPHFHFSPTKGWLNDPNGLIFHQGEYHLFYQWCEMLKVDTNYMCWAHAVSKDLVHWEHLPVSLEPDELGAIWSGSAVNDANNTSGLFEKGGGLVAIFTHHSRADAERQSLAFSSDLGRTWTKYAKNPVLGSDADRDFRDPKVFWHEPSRRWVMVVGVRHRLYASENLRDWTHLSDTGFKSECPDLFPIPLEGRSGSKWLLSLGGREYVIGDFDGRTFHAESPALPVEAGLDFYATQSWECVPDGRRVWIGWVNNWKYSRAVPDFGALGFMSVPRTLELRDIPGSGLRLVQKPVAELSSLRSQVQRPTAGELARGLKAGAFEIEAELTPSAGDRCGFAVRTSENGSQQTLVGYDQASGTIFIDRDRSGLAVTNGTMSAPLPLRGGRVKLHAYVDTLSVEVFFNDGEAVLSAQIYPDAGSQGLRWFSENGKSGVEDVSLWPL